MTAPDRDALLAAVAAYLDQVGSLDGRVAALENEPVPQPPPTPVADLSSLGVVAVDSFPGTDFEKWQAAVRAEAANTFKRTLVFSARRWNLRDGGSPVAPYRGLRTSGPLGGSGDEFRHSVDVLVPAGGLLQPNAQRVSIRDCSFTMANPSDYLLGQSATDGTGGTFQDVQLSNVGIFGGGILVGALLRVDLDRMYVNGATQTVLRCGGSDSWLWASGRCFISGTLPADQPFVDIGMDMTRVGQAYITAQGGYALRLFYSRGGLVIDGARSDDWGRTGTLATQQAGLKITGGTAVTVNDWWSSNVNASGASKGDIEITGGSDLILNRPVFVKAFNARTAVRATGPAIYASAPVKVRDPRFIGGYVPSVLQAKPGLITGDVAGLIPATA